MEKKMLESAFGTPLILNGFMKRGTHWYRKLDEVLQVVNLQRSAYGQQYYVNLCCVPVGMNIDGLPTPKEHNCPIRIRFTAAFPERREEIENAFDLERPEVGALSRADRIASLTNELVVPFLIHMESVEALRRGIQEGAFKGGSIHLSARRYLNLADNEI